MAASQMTLGMTIALADRFHLAPTRDQNGNYRVEDPVIQQFYLGAEGKTGVYVDRDRIKALKAAVLARQEHDALMESRRGFGKVDPIRKAPTPAKRLDTVQSRQVKAMVAKQAAAVSPPPPPPLPSVVVPTPARKARVIIQDDEDNPPEMELEVDVEDLDNTGKREKNRREEPRRSKKVSVFASAAKVLVKNPTVGREELANKGAMSPASAKICRVAWTDILDALRTAGALSPVGLRLIQKAQDAK